MSLVWPTFAVRDKNCVLLGLPAEVTMANREETNFHCSNNCLLVHMFSCKCGFA